MLWLEPHVIFLAPHTTTAAPIQDSVAASTLATNETDEYAQWAVPTDMPNKTR